MHLLAPTPLLAGPRSTIRRSRSLRLAAAAADPLPCPNRSILTATREEALGVVPNDLVHGSFGVTFERLERFRLGDVPDVDETVLEEERR